MADILELDWPPAPENWDEIQSGGLGWKQQPSEMELLRREVEQLAALLVEATDHPVSTETQYVTLDQMAATVQRSKRTLEKLLKRKQNPLPSPDILGGGGKPNEWNWARIRIWLEKEYKRNLPAAFPRKS